MNLQEQFQGIIRNHDDMENDLHLSEGEAYTYLQNMLPIEQFLKEHQGKGLSWDYTGMRQEESRFHKLSPTANIQISRHFRYDCSRCHTHDYFQLNYILEGRPVIHYGDENYQASPGDYFLLAPGVPHWIDSYADDIIILKVYIRYSTFENTFFRLLGEQNVLADFFRRVLYEGDTRKGYLCFRTNNTASLREHMLETYRLFLNRVEYLNIILECRITELFCTLVRLYTETDPSGEPIPVLVTGAQRLHSALEILKALEANDIVGEAASVDVSILESIVLWYGTRYQVNLGDTSRMEYKIAYMKGAILELSEYQSGILDVSFTTWPDRVGYTPFSD